MDKVIVSETKIEVVTVKHKQPDTIVVKQGPRGEKGAGVASGGTKGQVLIKQSDDDFDTTYANPYRTFVSTDQPETLLEGDVWIKIEE